MRRSLLLGAFVIALSGCSDGPAAPDEGLPDIQLVLISGNNQSAAPGAELPQPLIAQVLEEGVPTEGVLVSFRVTAGGGRVFAGSARSNTQGRVIDYWTLGPVAGEPQAVEVRAVRNGEKRVYATFTATALPPQ